MVNIRNWVKLFWRTLFIGGGVTIITGFIVQWDQHKELFLTFNMTEILFVALWFLGMGFLFSVISQMGYMAYLMVNRLGLGLFRTIWNPVQIILIAFALFDLVYFRYIHFAQEGEGLFSYILLALLLLLAGLVFAYLKMKQSHKGAFVPALFFIVVITTIEWYPALRLNDAMWMNLMIYPLLLCNAYQLLALPKYIERSKQERKIKQSQKVTPVNQV